MIKQLLYIGTVVMLVYATLIQQGHIESRLLYILTESNFMNIVRIGLAGVFLLLLMVQPPRPVLLRAALLVFGVMLLCGGISSAFSYDVGIFDALLVVLSGITLVIESLESTVRTKASGRPAAA